MLRWIYRITPLVLGLLVAANGYAQSRQTEKNAVPDISTHIKPSHSQFVRSSQASHDRRVAVSDRAGTVFTLFASELALQQGMAETALAVHEKISEKTNDPAVVARSMEMALSVNALPQAAALLQQWQKLDPADSPEKQRLSLQLALQRRDNDFVINTIEPVLKNATDYQLRQLFLLLAQFSVVQQNSVLQKIYPAVHQTAQAHQKMAEAVIADAFYTSLTSHRQEAMVALRRLADIDGNIQPVTRLSLGLIEQQQPGIIADFFQNNASALPAMWQSIYVETLISQRKLAEAYAFIQPVLLQRASPELYLQALFLAVNQQVPEDTLLTYAGQAYALGNETQKNKAALLMAVYLADHEQIAAARQWAAKINLPAFNFDRAILMATIEQEDKHWKAAESWLKKIRTGKNKGLFFDQENLFRLQIIQATETLKPKQYIQQLNQWLKVAEAKKDSDRTAQLIYLRGSAYIDKLHQPQLAVQDFRQFLKLRPDDAIGLNTLGYTLLSLPEEHWQEAQKLLERAYQLDSQSVYINDSLGWAYYLNGEVQQALPLLQYSYAHFPDAEVAAHLGAALWDSGQHDQALQIWAQGMAQKNDPHNALKQTLKRFGIKPETLPAAKVTGPKQTEN